MPSEIELYPTGSTEWEVENDRPLKPNPNCELCSRHKKAKSRCLGADEGSLVSGDTSKSPIVVVFPSPSRIDDVSGISCSDSAFMMVRDWVDSFVGAPVVYTYGVRCHGPRAVTGAQLRECRPYLAHDLKQYSPKIIYAFGNAAYKAVVGSNASARVHSYSWAGNYSCYVVAMPDPNDLATNSTKRNEFKEIFRVWHNAGSPAKPPRNGKAIIVDNIEAANSAFDALSKQPFVAFDVETYGRRFYDDDYKLLSIAFSGPKSDDAYVWLEEHISDPVLFEPAKRILEDPQIFLVGQNVKFDVGAIKEAIGIDCHSVCGDSRVWSKMLDHDQMAGLAVLSGLVGMGGHKDEAKEILQLEKKRLIALDGREIVAPMAYAYAALPREILARYNGLDAITTAKVAYSQWQAFEGFPNVYNHWNRVVKGASWAISHIEQWGFPIDRDSVVEFSEYLDEQKAQIKQTFAQYGEFNPDSTAEVGELLFNRLGLRSDKRTSTGRPSVDKATLEKLSGKHPVVDAILSWRKLCKMQSTYAEGMLPYIAADGRVHPDILLDGAASGRLSCRNPNLQNIPRSDTDLGKRIRKAFKAQPGKVLIQADYSTLELRIAAILSQDETMCDVFRSGVDYHLRTAQMVSEKAWGIPPDKVEKTHRTAAKAVNFGLLYGMSDYALGRTIGCSTKDAAEVRNAILGNFPKLARWIAGELREAKKTGYARTYWGRDEHGNNIPARMRPLRGLGSPDEKIKASAERAAWNTPVQGTASDFCLASIVEVVKWIFDDCFPGKLVLTVHDSILLEVDEEAVEEACWNINRLMTQWDTAGVPLAVDIEIGTNWADLTPYTLKDA